MKTFIRSAQYATQGIGEAFKGRNFRIQCAIGLAVVLAGFIVEVSAAEWCILLFAIALVLALEIINTALENLVNLVSPQLHPVAGKVKDLVAGAVWLASITAAIVGLIIFLPYLKF